MYYWNPAGSVASASDWCDAFTGLHGASRLTVVDAGPWTGRLEWQQSQSYGIALCGGTEERFSRETRHIRSDPRGAYELLVPRAGSAWVEQGSSSAEIRSGFLALCDIDRPVSFAHEADFVSVALIVPGEEVDRRDPAATREPRIFSGVSGLGRVIRHMVYTLQEERAQLSETTFDIACEQLLDLVCLAAGGATDSAPARQRVLVEAEIRRYVRRHAGDRVLNVAGIARALGWSTRYIQEVLRAANTTSRDLIRTERLRLARTRLASASWSGQPIAEIAYASGFGSHASFTTAFRQEFGLTPREARNQVLPASVNQD